MKHEKDSAVLIVIKIFLIDPRKRCEKIQRKI